MNDRLITLFDKIQADLRAEMRVEDYADIVAMASQLLGKLMMPMLALGEPRAIASLVQAGVAMGALQLLNQHRAICTEAHCDAESGFRDLFVALGYDETVITGLLAATDETAAVAVLRRHQTTEVCDA